MEQNNNIAVIIPAYKKKYLDETLHSFKDQTDKHFTIYIGDDCSPEDLYSVIQPYMADMNIKYKRFSANLGQKSLPEHWNRCMKLKSQEEWIWLFSDDDYVTPNCIEQLYDAIKNNPQKLVFRFNSIKVKDGISVRINNFPDIINTQDFLNIKLGYKCESYAIEYVFHASLLEKINFQSFPFGWCSDDLFWTKASFYSDIKSISNANVYWRFSDINISGKKNGTKEALGKLRACLMFIEELLKEASISEVKNNIQLIREWFMGQYRYLSPSLDKSDKLYIIELINKNLYLENILID